MSLNSKRRYSFDEFELQLGARVLMRKDRLVPLGSKAFEVLVCLVSNAGEVVTKAELLATVWPKSHVEEATLSQHVFSLRKALGDRAKTIVTVPGRGYQFAASVHEITDASAPIHGNGAGSAGDSDSILIKRFTERLHTVIEEITPTVQPRAQHGRRLTWLLPLAIVILAAGGFAGWRWKHPVPVRDHQKIVVADIVNTTGDNTFDGTLKRALEIDLEQSPYIDIMSGGEVAGTLTLMGRKSDAPLDVDVARELCVRANRQVLLTANISQIGSSYLLMLEATDCTSGKELAAAKANASTRERVFVAVDNVTDKIRSQLGEPDKSVASFQVPIAAATTPSLEALKAYSIGTSMEAQGKEESEILPLFQRAVELDPNFAMAYGEIATQHYNLSQFDLASRYYKKAFDLSGHVSERERLIIEAHYYAEGQKDLEQGIRVYQLWAATYPHDWVPWLNMANEYTQIGQYRAAVAAGERALQLERDRAVIYSVLARAYKRDGRFADAKATGALAIQRGKDSTGVHGTLYAVAWEEKDEAGLERELQWNKEHGGWYGVYLQALSSAAEGRYKQSETLFHSSISQARSEGLTENPDGMLSDEANIERLSGYPDTARRTLLLMEKDYKDSFWYAIDSAELGDTRAAEAFLASHSAEISHGTLMTYLEMPQLRAAVDLARHKPAQAIAALESTRPYQMAGYEILSLRAQAYLQTGEPGLAIEQYKAILDNQGISFGLEYSLAHLGLARAYAAAGNMAASRAEYQSLLAVWSHADPDLPILQTAKSELERLR
jgi:DNA-binding winged helix-turn-helix (wHTH) protein/tetratricopeptide (TPR) repeat protein